jgi:hypothetical protein
VRGRHSLVEGAEKRIKRSLEEVFFVHKVMREDTRRTAEFARDRSE